MSRKEIVNVNVCRLSRRNTMTEWQITQHYGDCIFVHIDVYLDKKNRTSNVEKWLPK